MTASLRALRQRFQQPAGPGRERRTHDYRQQWSAFTRRLSRLDSVPEIGRELAGAAARASGAVSVAVYLADGTDARYHLIASVGSTRFARAIDQAGSVPTWPTTNVAPAPLPAELLPSVTRSARSAALGVPIHWRSALLGFIVLAPRPAGAKRAAGDLELLPTMAAQAAASITAIRLAEASVQPGAVETNAVIHDIKNSVSALSMLARNAGSHFADPEFQRDAMATLSCTVERMRRLLVKLSPPDTEPAPVPVEPIDLREVIIEATAPLAAQSKIRLVRRLQSVNTVYGDRDALLRVVENLATNAAEAMDHRGTVTVTLAEEEGHAVISVADTGCGIPAEYQERHLFAPFRSTKKGGWGVGLYQTKQAVERQDGEILVQSVEGGGATFIVKLPLLPLRTDVDSPSLESVR